MDLKSLLEKRERERKRGKATRCLNAYMELRKTHFRRGRGKKRGVIFSTGAWSPKKKKIRRRVPELHIVKGRGEKRGGGDKFNTIY